MSGSECAASGAGRPATDTDLSDSWQRQDARCFAACCDRDVGIRIDGAAWHHVRGVGIARQNDSTIRRRSSGHSATARSGEDRLCSSGATLVPGAPGDRDRRKCVRSAYSRQPSSAITRPITPSLVDFSNEVGLRYRAPGPCLPGMCSKPSDVRACRRSRCANTPNRTDGAFSQWAVPGSNRGRVEAGSFASFSRMGENL
jgi:hypothetical protein